jgi:hypothetical protein
MVRSARFSWNDEDHFETPDRSSGLEGLDDFDFDGLDLGRLKRRPNDVESGESRKVESGERRVESQT